MEFIKTAGIKKWYFSCSYFLFIAGFFLVPKVKWHDTFFYLVICIPFLLTMSRNAWVLLKKSKTIQIISLLCIYLLLTPIWGDNFNFYEYARLVLKFFALVCFLCLTAELSLKDDRFLNWFIKLLVYASIFGLFMYILVQHYVFMYPPLRMGNIGDMRNPIFVGDAFGVLMITLYYQVIPQEKPWNNLMYLFLMLIMFIAVILTQSRGPLLALLVSFMIGSIMVRDMKMISVIAVFLTVSGILLFKKNVFLCNLILERGTSYRFDLIVYAMKKISESPVWGHGIFYSGYNYIITKGIFLKHPHNLYLGTWIYGGIIGLVLMISFQARGLWIGIRKYLSDGNPMYFVWVIYASICVFTDHNNIISRPYCIYLFFWMVFGLISAYEVSSQLKLGEEV